MRVRQELRANKLLLLLLVVVTILVLYGKSELLSTGHLLLLLLLLLWLPESQVRRQDVRGQVANSHRMLGQLLPLRAHHHVVRHSQTLLLLLLLLREGLLWLGEWAEQILGLRIDVDGPLSGGVLSHGRGRGDR